MSDVNSSLIGFLKKKSLFSASPEKSARRNKSKEKQSFANTPITPRQNLIKTNPEINSVGSKNKHQSSQRQFETYEPQPDYEHKSMMQESPIRYEIDIQPQKPKKYFNFKTNKNQEEREERKPTQQPPQTSVWSGLVNHTTSFESARIQSAQCLQNLSTKIHAQVSSINYKIDMFNSKMAQILNKEFKNLEQNIYHIVQNVFAQSEKNIRIYIKQQEEILAAELIHMKENLQVELQKVEIMREEINKPGWRKVAGELLSSELQTQIQQMLKRSKSIEVGHWEVGDLATSKVNALERQVRQMITLSAR